MRNSNLKHLLLIGAAILCLGYGATAQSQYKLYAGFVYHFAKFTQWTPEKSTGDFVIGVYGADGMVSAAKALAASKKVGSRKIVVKKLASVSEAKACNILFVGAGKKGDISSASSMAKANNVLLITESPNATAEGSAINFTKAGGKVAFELSVSSAKSQKVKISSELQKLAIVKS